MFYIGRLCGQCSLKTFLLLNPGGDRTTWKSTYCQLTHPQVHKCHSLKLVGSWEWGDSDRRNHWQWHSNLWGVFRLSQCFWRKVDKMSQKNWQAFEWWHQLLPDRGAWLCLWWCSEKLSVLTSPALGAAAAIPDLCMVLLVNLWLAQCLQPA